MGENSTYENFQCAKTLVIIVLVVVGAIVVWTFFSSMGDLFNPFNFLGPLLSPIKSIGSSLGSTFGFINPGSVLPGTGLLPGVPGVGDAIPGSPF